MKARRQAPPTNFPRTRVEDDLHTFAQKGAAAAEQGEERERAEEHGRSSEHQNEKQKEEQQKNKNLVPSTHLEVLGRSAQGDLAVELLVDEKGQDGEGWRGHSDTRGEGAGQQRGVAGETGQHAQKQHVAKRSRQRSRRHPHLRVLEVVNGLVTDGTKVLHAAEWKTHRKEGRWEGACERSRRKGVANKARQP